MGQSVILLSIIVFTPFFLVSCLKYKDNYFLHAGSDAYGLLSKGLSPRLTGLSGRDGHFIEMSLLGSDHGFICIKHLPCLRGGCVWVVIVQRNRINKLRFWIYPLVLIHF